MRAISTQSNVITEPSLLHHVAHSMLPYELHVIFCENYTTKHFDQYSETSIAQNKTLKTCMLVCFCLCLRTITENGITVHFIITLQSHTLQMLVLCWILNVDTLCFFIITLQSHTLQMPVLCWILTVDTVCFNIINS